MTYRVGNHQPQNVYRGDAYIGVMFDPVDAELVVNALEARPADQVRIQRNYEQLVAALARSRESQGLSLAEVAQRMDRGYLQQVHNWLNGAMECRSRRLFALAHALGYDLALVPREQCDHPQGTGLICDVCGQHVALMAREDA